MKRILALTMAVLMVAALFVGCQKNDGATDPSTPGASDSKPAETKKPGEIPTLHWYTVGNGMAPNQDSWAEKMNAYLEEKIGVHLDYQIIPWADYGTRTDNMIATNEYYDIVFGDFAKYRKNVNMNAFLELGQYLDQVPGLRDVIPQPVWEAATVNGGIYGVPTYKDVAAAQYWRLETEFADTYLPNYAECVDMEDYTDALVAYKEATGKLPIVTGGFNLIYPHYDGLALGIDAYGVDMYAEGSPKIIETFRDPYAVHEYEVMRDWIAKGVMNDDGAVRKDITEYDYVMSMGQGWPSAWLGSKVPCYTVAYREPVMSNGSCLGSINHISSSTKHPLECLKLLELVNTDPWVRDAFCYGEEGVNFEYIEENGEKKVHRLNEDWGGANYTQGQFFIETPLEGTVGNPMVDEVLVNNEKAHVSPCIGFYPDTTEIEDKLDEIRGIQNEFGKLINSTGDPAAIDEMYGRMDDVGAQEVIAELQRQLDAWWAEKNA